LYEQKKRTLTTPSETNKGLMLRMFHGASGGHRGTTVESWKVERKRKRTPQSSQRARRTAIDNRLYSFNSLS